MKKINIGFVGMGFIADWHYKAFHNNSNARIVGMTQDLYGDSEKRRQIRQRLEAKCAQWNIRAYEDFESIAADPEIDALMIGSVTNLHYEQIRNAIQNNKHLLVEKPVVTDLKQLDDIENWVETGSIKFFPAHNFVYRNAVLKAREILDSGEIGEIIQGSFISTHSLSQSHVNGWRAKKKIAGGGALIDSGHHQVYQMLYLMGMPVKLHAFTSKRVQKHMDCEDTAQINLQFGNGSVAVILQSWATAYGESSNGIKIIGEKGELVITDALYLNGKVISDEAGYEHSFVNQASAFCDYLIKDKPPVSALKDVRNTLKIILGAYQSAAEEKVLTLSDH